MTYQTYRCFPLLLAPKVICEMSSLLCYCISVITHLPVKLFLLKVTEIQKQNPSLTVTFVRLFVWRWIMFSEHENEWSGSLKETIQGEKSTHPVSQHSTAQCRLNWVCQTFIKYFQSKYFLAFTDHFPLWSGQSIMITSISKLEAAETD